MATTLPYPGLRPFDCDEVDIFFGREEQVDQLVFRLARYRFLAVIGSSGSGKSSVVRAGLVPWLKAGGMPDAGSLWRCALMRPENRPMHNLAKALLDDQALGRERAGRPQALGIMGASLARGPLGVVEVLRETRLPEETNLLLVVDQFEEIFRFSREGDRDEAAAFVALLLATARRPDVRAHVVITMRSDFIGDCAIFTGLPEAVTESDFLTPRLTRDQRRKAIVGPARVFGGNVEDELVNLLLNETGSDPDHLPVLQHLLLRMWQMARKREGKTTRVLAEAGTVDTRILPEVEAGPTLTIADYEAVGGFRKALSNHANEGHASLGSVDREWIAEIIFRRLSEQGPDNRSIRRPTSVAEIAGVAHVDAAEVISVADVFRAEGTSFVLPPGIEPLTPRSILDISHESLIRQWDRLKAWAEEESHSAQQYLRLEDTARRWANNKAALWGTPDLETALTWKKNEFPSREWAKRYGGDFPLAMRFLDESEREQEKRRAKEEAEHKAKLEKAEQEAADQKRRADEKAQVARTFKGLSIAAVLACGVALVFAAIAVTETRHAQRATDEAKINESLMLAGQSVREGDQGNARKAIILALEALPKQLDARERPLVSSANDALFEALYRPRGMTFEGHVGRLRSADFNADGSRIVTAAEDQTIRLWDAATGASLPPFDLSDKSPRWASFDPSGRRVVVAYSDKNSKNGASLLDTESRDSLDLDPPHEKLLSVASFSSSGRLVLAASYDGMIRIWDAETREHLQTLRTVYETMTAAFSPKDENLVLTSSRDGLARIWNWRSPAAEPKEFKTKNCKDELTACKQGPVLDAEFDHQGDRIVTASEDGTAWIWDVVEGGPVRVLRGHTKQVTSATFSPDGTRIATLSRDLTIRIWDAATGETLLVQEGPSEREPWRADVSFSPDGRRVLATFLTDRAYLWDVDLTSDRAARILPAHSLGVSFAAFSHRGDRFATASPDGTAKIFFTEGSRPPVELKGHGNAVMSVAFSLDDRRIITASYDGTARIWDAQTGQELRAIPAGRGPLFFASLNPDGTRLATASSNGTASLWEASSGRHLLDLNGHASAVTSVAFDASGDSIVTASWDGTARVWNATTGQAIGRLGGHDGTVMSAQFDREGHRVVTASVDRKVRVWDLQSPVAPKVFSAEGAAVDFAAFSPDGGYVLAACSDHIARLWNIRTGTLVLKLLGHREKLRSAVYDATGQRILSASTDGTARLWKRPISLATRIRDANALNLPPLTPDERRRLGLSEDGQGPHVAVEARRPSS